MRELKWFRVLVVGLASVLVLGACGGDDDNGGDDNGEAQQEVPVEDYVADFCGAMVDWQTSIEDLSTDFRENVFTSSMPPEEKRTELEGYLEDLNGITSDFIDDVEAAGIPDVEGGEGVAEEFLSGFRQLTGAIDEVQGQVGDLPTDSEATFTTAAQELVGQIQTSFQTIGDSLTDIQSDPIDQAFNEEEACTQIQTG